MASTKSPLIPQYDPLGSLDPWYAKFRQKYADEKERLNEDLGFWDNEVNFAPIIQPIPKELRGIHAPKPKRLVKPLKRAPVKKTIKQLIPSAPAFMMGVEFEGGVRSSVRDELEAYMLDLACDELDDPIIQFGKDNSVKHLPRGFEPVEIRTQTLPLDSALIVFEQMLSFLYLASQTNDFVTNDTCGLHINISEPYVFRIDQLPFYCHVVNLFDENKVLELFGRGANKFCMPFVADSEDRDIKSILRRYKTIKRKEDATKAAYGELWVNGIDEAKLTKYFAVALRDAPVHKNYHGPDVKAHRVEFRCIGNDDYHLRHEDLDASVNHMLETVTEAFYQTLA